MSGHSEQRDALAWLAFRYLTDELSAAELEAFEARLDQDQAAREMLADVVRLTAAARLVPVAVAAPLGEPARWPRSLGWSLAGMAAGLLVAWGASSAWTQRPAFSEQDRQLAWAWAETLGRDGEAGDAFEPGDAEADVWESDGGGTSDDAPSWLLDALEVWPGGAGAAP